jgi:hypothetical protein
MKHRKTWRRKHLRPEMFKDVIERLECEAETGGLGADHETQRRLALLRHNESPTTQQERRTRFRERWGIDVQLFKVSKAELALRENPRFGKWMVQTASPLRKAWTAIQVVEEHSDIEMGGTVIDVAEHKGSGESDGSHSGVSSPGGSQ